MNRLAVILLLLVGHIARGASYYIDWDAGSDANAGTSTGAAWKRHPYMTGWAGSYSHAAGDRFLFKGGVTWPSTALPLTIAATGSSDSVRDYYGTTNGWGTGRAVFDSEYETNYSTIDADGVAGSLTFSDLEVKRLTCSANFGPGLLVFSGAVSVTITNCYIHSWRLDPAVSTDDAHGGVINAFGGDSTLVIDGCEIENSANIDRWNGVAVRQWGAVRNSRIHNNSSGVLFCLDFDGSLLYRIAYPSNSFDATYHLNGVYLDPMAVSSSTVGYIRNSRFWDVSGGANMAYPNPRGATVYVYNNRFHGVQSSQMAIEIDPYAYGSTNATGDVYVYNNTISLYGTNWPGIHVVDRSGLPKLRTLVARNNHVIGAGTATISDASSGTVATNVASHNLIQTPAVAVSQGYTSTNYAPSLASGGTVDTGTNSPSGLFTTDSLTVTRPKGSAWDIGAYEFQSVTNLLLVLTEPTARGLAGPIFDQWLEEILAGGFFTPVVVELPRWTGSWNTNDWPGLNRMSNWVARYSPAAVQIFGRLPPLMTGGNNWDGHGELRRIVTDAWLGCSGLTFTDTDNWGMVGTLLGNPYVLATNVPGDGIPDETSGTFSIPVSRIDASGLTSFSGNFAAGSYLSGQPFQPAIAEGEWLRRYLTNAVAHHRGEIAYTDTGHIYAAGWLNHATVTSFNTAVTWTTSPWTSPNGLSPRWVYSQNELQDLSTNWISGAGVAMRCIFEVNYKSYQYEIANGQGTVQRRLFPGVIDRPWALVAGWCVGAAGNAYWVSAPADRTVADAIRTSAVRAGGSSLFYPIAGDLTLPMDPVTRTPSRRITVTSATVGTMQ